MSFLLSAGITAAVVFSALAPSVSFGLGHVVAAQTDDGATNSQSLRQRIEERREALQAQAQERRAALDERRRERISNFFEKMTVRLDILFRNLDRFEARIESLVDKFEEKGKDVTVVREKLAQAHTESDEAKAAYALLKDAFAVMLEADHPREAFADVREALKNLKQELRQTHLSFVGVLRELKGASGGVSSQDQSSEDESTNEDE